MAEEMSSPLSPKKKDKLPYDEEPEKITYKKPEITEIDSDDE